KVDNHNNTRLHGGAEGGEKAHPDRDREVVAEGPEEIDPARQCEWNRHDHMRRFDRRVVGEIQQTEDDDEHDGYDEHQPLSRSLLVLILSAPREVITSWKLHLFRDDGFRLIDESSDVQAT